MNNPFDPGYFTEDEILNAGLKSIGENVKIYKNVS